MLARRRAWRRFLPPTVVMHRTASHRSRFSLAPHLHNEIRNEPNPTTPQFRQVTCPYRRLNTSHIAVYCCMHSLRSSICNFLSAVPVPLLHSVHPGPGDEDAPSHESWSTFTQQCTGHRVGGRGARPERKHPLFEQFERWPRQLEQSHQTPATDGQGGPLGHSTARGSAVAKQGGSFALVPRNTRVIANATSHFAAQACFCPSRAAQQACSTC